VWHYLTTSYRMDRSELQLKSCREKESKFIEGKCYKDDQSGYTLLSTTKCSNILQLHWRHLILSD
jgi:hypothetical protein